jgi:hypothetical protein
VSTTVLPPVTPPSPEETPAHPLPTAPAPTTPPPSGAPPAGTQPPILPGSLVAEAGPDGRRSGAPARAAQAGGWTLIGWNGYYNAPEPVYGSYCCYWGFEKWIAPDLRLVAVFYYWSTQGWYPYYAYYLN